MGRFKKGINGSFHGLVGTAVGTKWKGRQVMRSLPDIRPKSATVNQLIQQAKFTTVIRFVSAMGQLLRFTYNSIAIKNTTNNSAFRQVYREALGGDYPDFNIVYNKVIISKGGLLNPGNITVIPAGGGVVKMGWDFVDSNLSGTDGTDRSIMVFYCPELNKATYTTTGAARSVQNDSVNLSSFTGKKVECWITFINANQTDFANSMYAGSIVVA